MGDFRVPSVEATCGKGSRTVDLRYVGHTVREGKYALEGLPAFYDEGVTAQTLSVELRDSCTGLEVELLYGVLEKYDLITRAVRVRNGGESPMELERVSSVCLDFPAGEHDLITLGGAYAREREPVRMPLTQGIHTVGSVRGTSSHQQNPFVVLCDHETTEDAGRCWGVALVYSGSFQANTEYTQFHETRLTLGINPFHFRWKLQPGESFATPEAAMVFSAQGLGPLAHRIEEMGMKFGLWVEPEMVNEDSDLYPAHPDWAFQVPGRPMTRGRSQLVLDLTRAEVRQYIMDNLRATLNSAPISYIKWDMNRSLTDVWSAALPAQRQGEVYHRYVLSVYEILEMLHQEFPQVLIEGCSGGGRFDCGMLYYTPQIWCSDNTNAIERLRIQYGTSFCYPCAAVGAHVSAVPNGQTGRSVSMHTRGVVAAAGTFGYELDLNEITSEEMEEVRTQIQHFRSCWDLVLRGDYYRLSNPFRQEAFNAWMHVSPDKSRALVGVVMGVGHANPIRPLLRLKGLDPNADYKVNGEVYGGDQLMYGGLALPILQEYQALQFDLERV